MNVESFRSKKTYFKNSGIEGRGLFASEAINKGEIVGIKVGHIISKKDFIKNGGMNTETGHCTLPISDEYLIGPLNSNEIEKSMVYSNHSCEPNVGILGNIIVVAMRDIESGEELTNDYALWLSDNEYKMECNCGITDCRKIITGNDWKNPELQKKYKGYFSSYIQKKIIESSSN